MRRRDFLLGLVAAVPAVQLVRGMAATLEPAATADANAIDAALRRIFSKSIVRDLHYTTPLAGHFRECGMMYWNLSVRMPEPERPRGLITGITAA